MYLNALKTYLQLKANLRRPLAKLREQQWRDFRDLVAFAYEKVPFYRQLYHHNHFSPNDLKSRSDIGFIPIIKKSHLLEAQPNDLIASGYDLRKLKCKHTSGSSGVPLNVYYTPEYRIYRTLLHLRILFHNGMGFFDRMVQICDARNVPDFRYGFQRLGILPKDFLYCGDPPEQQLVKFAEFKPKVVYSYASNMVLLAAEVRREGYLAHHPDLIFTTGEMLTPDQRQVVDQAFQTRLRDIYAMVEMGDVSWQCPILKGYHVNMDSFLVEVLQHGEPVRPGEIGRLVITNLHSKAMPFIRYDIGDVLSAPTDEPCPCGCTFPRIEVVQGKADDWLYTTDGKQVSSMAFIIASIPGVKQYRVIQHSMNFLTVEILPAHNFTPDTLQKVKKHVLEVVGEDMVVQVNTVDNIPMQAGKIRSVISELGK
jgi:phenylacetate-CoA ligase